MMNRGYFKISWKERVRNFILPDYIMDFLVAMRKVDYYSTGKRKFYIGLIINYLRFNRSSMKLGFSIGYGVFGYGLVIPHYGTIVVGGSNCCGNYCVLHTSTCISGNAKMTTQLVLGDNVSVGANSLVNKSFPDRNVLLVGTPAKEKHKRTAWYIDENSVYFERVKQIEKLKREMGLV